MKGNKMNFTKCTLIATIGIAFASCGNNETTPPATHTDQRDLYKADKGRLLFETKCATCHGNDGTAGITNAANLQISRLDINSIKEMINTGKNGMPPFKSQFAPEDIDKIAEYVQTLRK